MALKGRFPLAVLVIQVAFVLIFAFCVEYGEELGPPVGEDSGPDHPAATDSPGSRFYNIYPWFQDVNAMIFLGVGCLYAFMRNYGHTGIGMNMLVAAISVQWSLVLGGWLRGGTARLDVESLLKSEFAAASAVIAFGGVFGKINPLQTVAFTLAVVAVFTVNLHWCQELFHIVDAGESVSLHMFAGIFGCAAAFAADRGRTVQGNANERTSNESNIFCMIGTMILWVFWPSFNGSLLTGPEQYRCMVNTFVALLGSCVSAFVFSSLLNQENKFSPSHIQNATLAGGVAIGTACNLLIQPYGALLIGAVGGAISVLGYLYVTPFLAKLQVYDPCGIHSLHALPGFFAGMTGILYAFVATEETYGDSLYQIYPWMAPPSNSTEPDFPHQGPDLIYGAGRSAETQALYQLAYVLQVVVVATVTGLLTGSIIRLEFFEPLQPKQMYLDEVTWVVPEPIQEEKKKNSISSVNDNKH